MYISVWLILKCLHFCVYNIIYWLVKIVPAPHPGDDKKCLFRVAMCGGGGSDAPVFARLGEEHLSVDLLGGRRVVNARQHVIHAELVCDERCGAAAVAHINTATQFAHDAVSGLIARRNVRMNGTVQNRLVRFDALPIDLVQNGRSGLAAVRTLAERRYRVRDKTRTRHRRHFLPIDSTSLQLWSAFAWMETEKIRFEFRYGVHERARFESLTRSHDVRLD